LLTYWPQIGTLVVRADVACAVGPFDSVLVGDQDWDWMLRIARRYPFGRIPDLVLLFYQRARGDEVLQWRRFPYVLRVFLKNTRDLPIEKQLQLRTILWRHRGWYASQFLLHGQQRLQEGDKRGAWRCLGYAVRASLPHTLSFLAKQSQSGIGSRRQGTEESDSGTVSDAVAETAAELEYLCEEALDR
jgi:hypothetical protein